MYVHLEKEFFFPDKKKKEQHWNVAGIQKEDEGGEIPQYACYRVLVES